MVQIKIEKLVFGGQGLGHLDGKAVFVWNALPGEEAEVALYRNKKDFAEGIAVKIIQPSSARVVPLEEHHLSCSPWQIMTIEAENQAKQVFALEVYRHIGKFEIDQIAIESDDDTLLHYRNKMEYSFMVDADEKVQLAFFNRGERRKQPIEPCVLADEAINQTALKLLGWIQEQQLPLRNLKCMIVRGNHQGQTIAALFLKDVLSFDSYPELGESCLGFQLYHSYYKTPAAVPTRLLYSVGQDFIEATLEDTKLKFGLLSFFQVNIPLFARALRDISTWIKGSDKVLDFYSGVGAISLPLARHFEHAVLVDNNAEAIAYAQENITNNKIINCEAVLSPAEQALDHISGGETVIFDPPRAGLHEDVLRRVLEVKPPRIVYLSCNLSTHARDIAALLNDYTLRELKLYNFFPRTPHVESLAVLERK